MEFICRLLMTKVLEAVYFSLFLIIGKNLKKKRILFIGIMIAEYLLLTSFIEYNVMFQLIYTFLSFINLKVLYKEKAQITDIFLFTAASLYLIFTSFICYVSVYFTIKIYMITLISNRIIIFLSLYFGRNFIRNKYVEFCSLWNRHCKPKKIKSLTLRNISIISFNLMFWLINIGMIFFVTYLK